MSNTPKWMLDPDLKTIREMARMKKPERQSFLVGRNRIDLEGWEEALKDYEEYLKTMKSYPAENFTPEYAGKELVEGVDFEIKFLIKPQLHRALVSVHKRFYDDTPDERRKIEARPLSNTANPKGEESQCLRKKNGLSECKEFCNGCFEFYKSSTPPTESEPDFGFTEWFKRNAAMKEQSGLWIPTTFSGMDFNKSYSIKEFYKHYQTHLQETKIKEL